MKNNNKWMAIVSITALVVAIVAFAFALGAGMTGNAIFGLMDRSNFQTQRSQGEDSLLVPLTEGEVMGPFPFNGEMWELSLGIVQGIDDCVSLNVLKGFEESSTRLFCTGENYSFEDIIFSIDYVYARDVVGVASVALIRMEN